MLNLLIVLTFIIFGYVAYRRGLAYQGVITVTFFLSVLFAALLYRFLIPLVSLWIPYPSASADSKFVFFSQTVGLDLDKSFYAGIAFALLLLIFWLAFGLFIEGFGWLRYLDLKIEKRINTLGAVLLSLIVSSGLVSLFLFLMAMIPLDGIQRIIDHAFLAKAFISSTPLWTTLYTHLFIGII